MGTGHMTVSQLWTISRLFLLMTVLGIKNITDDFSKLISSSPQVILSLYQNVLVRMEYLTYNLRYFVTRTKLSKHSLIQKYFSIVLWSRIFVKTKSEQPITPLCTDLHMNHFYTVGNPIMALYHGFNSTYRHFYSDCSGSSNHIEIKICLY